MTWELAIEQETGAEGVTRLGLRGRIGTAAAARVIEAVAQAIDQGQRRLVLDLSAVDYVSSAGLLAFDAAADRIRGAGGMLVLCSLTEPVRLAFDLGGRLDRFLVEASAAEAAARLGATQTFLSPS